MATINNNTALLLYRVGPVFCASPCLQITAIVTPPPLTHPPGSDSAHPGVFKHDNAIVRSLDLRYKFGIEESQWAQPGRTVITQLAKQHIGFYVDEILDVVSVPKSGWGALPALLPRGVFTRTLMLYDQICLYADFNDLQRIPDSGYLHQYIQHLIESAHTTQPATERSLQPSEHTSQSDNVSAPASMAKSASKKTAKLDNPTTSSSNDATPIRERQNTRQQGPAINSIKTSTLSAPAAIRTPATTEAESCTITPLRTTLTHGEQARQTTKPQAVDRKPRPLPPQQPSPVKPATSTPASRQSTMHSPSSTVLTPNTSSDSTSNTSVVTRTPERGHSRTLIISFLLLIALTGGTIWYLFFDDPVSLNIQYETPAVVDDVTHEQLVVPAQNKPQATTTETQPGPMSPSLPEMPSEQKTLPPDIHSTSTQPTLASP